MTAFKLFGASLSFRMFCVHSRLTLYGAVLNIPTQGFRISADNQAIIKVERICFKICEVEFLPLFQEQLCMQAAVWFMGGRCNPGQQQHRAVFSIGPEVPLKLKLSS